MFDTELMLNEISTVCHFVDLDISSYNLTSSSIGRGNDITRRNSLTFHHIRKVWTNQVGNHKSSIKAEQEMALTKCKNRNNDPENATQKRLSNANPTKTIAINLQYEILCIKRGWNLITRSNLTTFLYLEQSRTFINFCHCLWGLPEEWFSNRYRCFIILYHLYITTHLLCQTSFQTL